MVSTGDTALVAHAMKGDRVERLEAGMTDDASKPMRFGEVRKMVEKRIPQPQQIADVGSPSHSVPVSSGGPARSAIDIAQALENLGGDRELFLEVVASFVEMIPQQMKGLREAAVHANLDSLRAISHSLKGSASNICAEQVRGLARQMEERCVGDEGVEGVRALLPELEVEVERLQTAASILGKQT
jgi:HPt (histidine-containing phosphotransfer) domain-containing protein